MATADVAAGQETRREGATLFAVIGGLMLVMLMAALDSTIVSTALPTIVGDLGGLEHISWVVTAYLLAQTVVMPLYGKLGDLYGRKLVLQVALVIFVFGSILCGQAQSMTELIAFRAIQGLGGGGLMVSAQAALGDVVSPRERGKYSGLFGGVFGVATVIGPLLGGFLTSELDWRWIFYVNVPVGAVAFVVLQRTLPAHSTRIRHTVDYLGTALLAIALTSVVLLTTLGGNQYAWGSALIVGLGVLAVLSVVGFVFAERRAVEPVLPNVLWRNPVFAVSQRDGLHRRVRAVRRDDLPAALPAGGARARPDGVGARAAAADGGAADHVDRLGPADHADGALPHLSRSSAARCSRSGCSCFSSLAPSTTTLVLSLEMFLVGAGLGLIMQVLVLAVQNAVDYELLGVATSGATLFRTIGGSLGTAILGAVFTSRLTGNLESAFPSAARRGKLSSGQVQPAQVASLPANVKVPYLQAFTDALDTVFLAAAGVAVLAFALSWFIQERTLRETVTTDGVGEAFASPRPAGLAARDRAVAEPAGRPRPHAAVHRGGRGGRRRRPRRPPPAGCSSATWRFPRGTFEELRAIHDGPARRARGRPGAVAGVRIRRGAGADGTIVVTPEGSAVADRLRAGARERLVASPRRMVARAVPRTAEAAHAPGRRHRRGAARAAGPPPARRAGGVASSENAAEA